MEWKFRSWAFDLHKRSAFIFFSCIYREGWDRRISVAYQRKPFRLPQDFSSVYKIRKHEIVAHTDRTVVVLLPTCPSLAEEYLFRILFPTIVRARARVDIFKVYRASNHRSALCEKLLASHPAEYFWFTYARMIVPGYSSL